MVSFVCFKQLASYIAGYEPEVKPLWPHQNFCPEPDKNDAAPQHWCQLRSLVYVHCIIGLNIALRIRFHFKSRASKVYGA
jgi:hypothetical protein